MWYFKSEFESVNNVVCDRCQGIIHGFQGDRQKLGCVCKERIMSNCMSCKTKAKFPGREEDGVKITL